jgi:uncharacterized protein DUF4350
VQGQIAEQIKWDDVVSRVRTVGWFVVTLIVLFILISPSVTNEDPVSRPTSEDKRTSGLAALVAWLRTADIPVVSVQQRFDDFAWESVSSTGNIAIVHMPGKLQYEAEEARDLMAWVAQGNSLLVTGGFLEGSPWIYRGTDLNRSLWRLTGLHLQISEASENNTVQDEVTDEDASTRAEELTNKLDLDQISTAIDDALNVPGWLLLHGSRTTVGVRTVDSHALFGDLPVLELPWDGARWQVPDEHENLEHDNSGDEPAADDESESLQGWRRDQLACAADNDNNWATAGHAVYGRRGCVQISSPAVQSWRTIMLHEASEQPAMLEATLGAGRLWLLMHPSLLDNDVMHRWNNRTFVMRLVDRALHSNGSVLLDDAHQGLNTIVEADDLLEDGRLYASIGFLLLFWMGYLLADAGQWQRAIYRPGRKNVGQVDLIAANGSFLRNRLRQHAACEMILEPLQERLSRKWQCPRDNALTQGLAKERSYHPDQVAALERSLSRLQAGRSIAPVTLAEQVFDLNQRIG